MIARAIHEASTRRQSRSLAINCAAIPDALLEGELFGHERGAFTEAVAQTPGRLHQIVAREEQRGCESVCTLRTRCLPARGSKGLSAHRSPFCMRLGTSPSCTYRLHGPDYWRERDRQGAYSSCDTQAFTSC
jgi:hypothetical protein